MVLEGHCNCNAVKVTVDDSSYSLTEPLTSIYCHCSTCRRQSGAGGTYVIVVDNAQVKIEGELKTWKDTMTDSGTALDRNFCGTCGCPVTSVSPVWPGKTVVKMGLFESVPKAVAEVYTRNKQSWEPDVMDAHQIEGAPPIVT